MNLKQMRTAARGVDRHDFEAVVRQRNEARADRDRYIAALTMIKNGNEYWSKGVAMEALRAASSRTEKT